jgi:DNA polymerase III delta prime subunit
MELPSAISNQLDNALKLSSRSYLIDHGEYADNQTYIDYIVHAAKIKQQNAVIVDPMAKDYDGINTIRLTIKLHNLRTLNNDIRAVFIKSAESLSREAMTALLKSLEEPTASSYYFLLCNNVSKIIDTIQSRCTTIKIKNLNLTQSIEYFSRYDKAQVTRAWNIANGNFGYMLRSLGESGSELDVIISKAKSFFEQNKLNKLKILYDLEHKDAILFTDILKKIATHQIRQTKDQVWISKYQKIVDAHELLLSNVSPKNVKLYLGCHI